MYFELFLFEFWEMLVDFWKLGQILFLKMLFEAEWGWIFKCPKVDFFGQKHKNPLQNIAGKNPE